MKIEDIRIGTTYTNGTQKRRVVNFGASRDWVVWGDCRFRLPLGGFINTRCTSTKSFAKWATEAVAE